MMITAKAITSTLAAVAAGTFLATSFGSAQAGQQTQRSEQWTPGVIVRADAQPAFKCNNKLANTLYGAGFRDEKLHFAWAVAMRESNGRNLDESSRYFTGALGIFQIQTEAWSNKGWWSREAMLDPDRQARIVYKYMTRGGTDWAHWGLNSDGTLNAKYYQGWSSQMRQNWIITPFRKFYKTYPCN